MRKTSLLDWCEQHNRLDILSEWDESRNLDLYEPFRMFNNRVEYSSWLRFHWNCPNGHHYVAAPVERTLLKCGCPICEGRRNGLPVGTKYGCLTIIRGFSDDWSERVSEIKEKVAVIKARKAVFLKGEQVDRIEPDDKQLFDGHSEHLFDARIRDYVMQRLKVCCYGVRCKCGREFDISESDFLKKKHRWCCDDCGLKKQEEVARNNKFKEHFASYERRFVPGYDVDLTGQIHETLHVFERVEDCEKLCDYLSCGVTRLSVRAHSGHYDVFAQYKCRCELCGKEYVFKHTDFDISPPTAYGHHAYYGYWSEAKCDCHRISSFQWIVTKILKEHNVRYRAEVYFDGLYGVNGYGHLRFDFCVFNDDNTVKCLIECQGEQHSEAVEEFGGESGLLVQQQNDAKKREFCCEYGLRLVEIVRVRKGLYEHAETVLRQVGVI